MKNTNEMTEQELRDYSNTLLQENRAIKMALRDMHPMARRYADNNPNHISKQFNTHTRTLLRLGVQILPSMNDQTIWARDPDGRKWDGLSVEEAKQGEICKCPINYEITYWKNKCAELEKQLEEGSKKWYHEKIKDYEKINYFQGQYQSLNNEFQKRNDEKPMKVARITDLPEFTYPESLIINADNDVS